MKNQITSKTNSSCLIILIGILLFLSSNPVLNGQPSRTSKKSVLSFKSLLGSEEEDNEDWALSIYMSSDCIHMYYAGYTETRPTGCNGIKMHVPVVGRFNTVTNTVDWVRTYFANLKDPNTQQLTTIRSRGQFNAVYELNGQLYASGFQNILDCDADENNSAAPILLIANAKTGDPLPEYPIFKVSDVISHNGLDYDVAVNLLPVTKNGVSDGTVGIGKIVPHGVSGSPKSLVFLLNNDGTLNTNFGTDGYFIGPDNTRARQIVKIDNPTNDVHYIVIGEIANSATDYDVYVDALTEDGKLASSWNEKYLSETILGSLYTDNTSEDAPICSSPGSYFENSIEWGWDVAQSGTNIYLSCIFDGVDNSIPDFYTQVCPEVPNDEVYSYKDIALIKLDLKDGKVISTVNVGVSEAYDFYPDLEVKDGRVCILGAKSRVENGNVITDGKLSEFDEDLNLVSEKIFSSHTAANDWDINCSFDLAFTCDNEIIVCGNNDINDEDYYFYKFSNGCQQNIETNSTDITSRHVVSGTEIWNTSKKVMDKVIVPANTTLEITNNNPSQTNTIIEFGSSWELSDYDELSKNQTAGKEPRIVVESGGHLILNNCFLRGLLGCSGNSMWDGIEVQNGGHLEMNNANISNARFGILASKGVYNTSGTLTPTNSTGGSIEVTGSSIIDCEYGVYFSRTSAPPVIQSTNSHVPRLFQIQGIKLILRIIPYHLIRPKDWAQSILFILSPTVASIFQVAASVILHSSLLNYAAPAFILTFQN